MSLQRSATKRQGPGAPRKKKGFEVVHQGIKELYSPPGKQSAEVDIVLVPGLGANPEDSWKSSKTDFNWTTHEDGLARDFPKARVLLYMYESAWIGDLKVEQFMGNLAQGLLEALNSIREDGYKRRPIVFIGHSMGGLVVAKAVCLAESRQDIYPIMFEAMAGAVFFGTPFDGAPVAEVAAMFAHVAEKFDKAQSSKLLDLMKPGNEELKNLRHELMRLASKVNPMIEMYCFWEEQPTDFSAMAGIPSLSGLARIAIPRNMAMFVSKDSATLQGKGALGLSCNHRDLVKFDSPKDKRWNQLVRGPLKRIIHSAPLAVRNRLNSTRGIDGAVYVATLEALEGEGASAMKRREDLRTTFPPSSWIPNEPEYTQWLGAANEELAPQSGGCMWIRGPEGRGKTSASMAALEGIDGIIKASVNDNASAEPMLLAYFFCDPAKGYCSAEDVLKSFLWQLIKQQPALTTYAKIFARKKGAKDSQQASNSVENLWMALMGMLSDDYVGSRVYFVINNLHALPEDHESTIKLMRFIGAEMAQSEQPQEQQQQPEWSSKRVEARWFVTSREAHNVQQALGVNDSGSGGEDDNRNKGLVRVVDLNDEKYGSQVQLELRKHAKKRVGALGDEKRYSKALSYFASSLIGKRAQNTQWIDITCVRLQELPQASSDLAVRGMLETTPQDLRTLLTNAWRQIFRASDDSSGDQEEGRPPVVDRIKEMLRTLVLTYEDPTEAELGMLAGLGAEDDSDSEEEMEELHALVDKCKPLLTVQQTDRGAVISFMNVVVKTHLLENARELLGMSSEERNWQHGVIALRCFSHLMCRFDFEPEQEPAEETNEGGEGSVANGSDNGSDNGSNDGSDNGSEDGSDNGSNDGSDEDDSDNDSDSGDSDSESEAEGEVHPEAAILENRALAYAVKHWLHHASNATFEIADDLSLETAFWERDSRVRYRWLVEYTRLTNTLEDFFIKPLTGLHVASAIGYRKLVAALIRNGYKDELNIRDGLTNSPLHLAAHFGRPKIVEELLNQGSAIDDGNEIEEQTPLHMAAFGGHVEVMKKLLLRGANPNATSNDIGPVVSAAISSGVREAVELIVEAGVPLTVDRDDLDPPLALSALLSDMSMFEYLIEKYADKLPKEEYSKALVKAADAGKMDLLKRLMDFEHEQEYLQRALNVAAEEVNWDIALYLLERYKGLNCDEVFYEAASGSEELEDSVFETIWDYTGGKISPQRLGDSLYGATDTEKKATVELLLNRFQADPNATGDEYGNALTASAYDGTLEILLLLIEAGADINSSNGWALQAAAAEGHYEVVEELLRRGADVNACTENDNFPAGTAIQGACEASRADIVRLLLDYQADPNIGRGSDSPPIVYAATQGDGEILEELLKARAKVDVFGGCSNTTPLILAAEYCPVKSLEALHNAGADINLVDQDGDTALLQAARVGDDQVVEFLLDNGADFTHANNNGEDALHLAVENGDNDCVRLLSQRVSTLLAAIKTEVGSGNSSMINFMRTFSGKQQALNYDEDTTQNTVEPPPVAREEPHEARATNPESRNVDVSRSSDASEAQVSETQVMDQSLPFHPSDPGQETMRSEPTSNRDIQQESSTNTPLETTGNVSGGEEADSYFPDPEKELESEEYLKQATQIPAELEAALSHQANLYNRLSAFGPPNGGARTDWNPTTGTHSRENSAQWARPYAPPNSGTPPKRKPAPQLASSFQAFQPTPSPPTGTTSETSRPQSYHSAQAAAAASAAYKPYQPTAGDAPGPQHVAFQSQLAGPYMAQQPAAQPELPAVPPKNQIPHELAGAQPQVAAFQGADYMNIMNYHVTTDYTAAQPVPATHSHTGSIASDPSQQQQQQTHQWYDPHSVPQEWQTAPNQGLYQNADAYAAAGWDEQRPELKPSRSSFFGVDSKKAKIMGMGFLNRNK